MGQVGLESRRGADGREERGGGASVQLQFRAAAAAVQVPMLRRFLEVIRLAPIGSVMVPRKAELFEQVKDTICSMHSFQCPCVLALPIEKANPYFLAWIDSETK